MSVVGEKQKNGGRFWAEGPGLSKGEDKDSKEELTIEQSLGRSESKKKMFQMNGEKSKSSRRETGRMLVLSQMKQGCCSYSGDSERGRGVFWGGN